MSISHQTLRAQGQGPAVRLSYLLLNPQCLKKHLVHDRYTINVVGINECSRLSEFSSFSSWKQRSSQVYVDILTLKHSVDGRW